MSNYLIKRVPIFFIIALLQFPRTAIAQTFDTTTYKNFTDSVFTEEETEENTSSFRDEATPEVQQLHDPNTFDPVIQFATTPVDMRNVPDSFVTRLKNNPDFSYVTTGLRKKEKQTPTGGNTHIPLHFLLYIAIAVFVGFLIWYLASNNLIFLKKNSKSVVVNASAIDQQDIFSIDYPTAIAQAVQQNNYRLAVRLQYLQLLKRMASSKLIHYLPDKTNFDYLTQLRSGNYYADFFALTRNYEYSWYGLFEVSEQAYKKIEDAFNRFQQKLGH